MPRLICACSKICASINLSAGSKFCAGRNFCASSKFCSGSKFCPGRNFCASRKFCEGSNFVLAGIFVPAANFVLAAIFLLAETFVPAAIFVFCLFCCFTSPCQLLWPWRDGQFTLSHLSWGSLKKRSTSTSSWARVLDSRPSGRGFEPHR